MRIIPVYPERIQEKPLPASLAVIRALTAAGLKSTENAVMMTVKKRPGDYRRIRFENEDRIRSRFCNTAESADIF
jgi:hypothetical protein